LNQSKHDVIVSCANHRQSGTAWMTDTLLHHSWSQHYYYYCPTGGLCQARKYQGWKKT